MNDRERPPTQPDAERSEIPDKLKTKREPVPETRELLERPPSTETEQGRKKQIAEIRESLHTTSDNGGTVPQPLESKIASKPTTKMDRIRAIGYEIFIDPILEKVRGLISNFIPENSKVIDIGCGTGALAFQLSRDKKCSVIGVDFAQNKIERAKQKANANSSKVHFTVADATSLEGISDQQFDVATMSLFLHSLPENVRHQVLQEAMRVAKRIVIADYVTKQPKSFSGFAVKGIERIAGGEHFQSFKQFSENGGLEALLQEAGLRIVEEQLNPSKTVRVVIVEKQKEE